MANKKPVAKPRPARGRAPAAVPTGGPGPQFGPGHGPPPPPPPPPFISIQGAAPTVMGNISSNTFSVYGQVDPSDSTVNGNASYQDPDTGNWLKQPADGSAEAGDGSWSLSFSLPEGTSGAIYVKAWIDDDDEPTSCTASFTLTPTADLIVLLNKLLKLKGL